MSYFKGFQKVHDDGKVATFRHENGHEMRVVHHTLSRKMRAELSKIPVQRDAPEVSEDGNTKLAVANATRYAEGGDVPPRDVPPRDPTADLAPANMLPTATDARTGEAAAVVPEPQPAAPQPPVTINISNGQQPGAPQPTIPQQAGQALGHLATKLPLGGFSLEDLGKAKAALPMASEFAEGLGSGVTGTPLQPPDAAPSLAAPAGAPPPPSGGGMTPAAPAAPGGPGLLPSPGEAMEGQYRAALSTGLKGVEKQSEAEQQLAGEKAKILGNEALSPKGVEDWFRKKHAENSTMIADVLKDVQSKDIDPKHYMKSLSTGDRIKTGIALVLGGFAGFGGHENPVSKMLDREIEQDLDAQRTNMDKRKNLLSALMQREGDIRAASDMFRVIRAATIAHDVDQAAAKAGTPMAQAKALQMKSQLLQQYAPVFMRANLASAMSKVAQSGDPDAVGKALPYMRQYAPEMAKEWESRYVPRVGTASIPLDQKTRDRLESGSNFLDKVHSFRTWSREHEGTVLDRAAVSYGQTLAQDLQTAYRQASNGGVFKPSEAEFINKLIPSDPTAFFNKLRVDPKLRAVEDSALTDMNHLRRSVGLPKAHLPAQYQMLPDGSAKRVQ